MKDAIDLMIVTLDTYEVMLEYLTESMRKEDLKCDNGGVWIREAHFVKLLCEYGCVLGQDLGTPTRVN